MSGHSGSWTRSKELDNRIRAWLLRHENQKRCEMGSTTYITASELEGLTETVRTEGAM